MNGLGPFSRGRVSILLGIDQLPARNSQFSQRFSTQIGQHEINARLDLGMHVPLKLRFVIALEPWRERNVVEHGFHRRAVERTSAVKRRDPPALSIHDRAESRIAFDTGVELGARVLGLMDPMQRHALRPRHP